MFLSDPTRSHPVIRAMRAGVSILLCLQFSSVFTLTLEARSFVGGTTPASGGTASGGDASAAGASSASAALARQLQSQRQSLVRSTQVLHAMQQAQAAARAAALQVQTTVPNGLGAGGLQVAASVDTDPSLWTGAASPVQTSGQNGRLVVKIDQNTQKTILTWDSFNVGRETDLVFDQQGNRDWIALNRVTDAQASPSKILGSIQADGHVYVINRNGVIFGGASQVNVGTLVASALPINDALLNANTLYGNSDHRFTFSAYSEAAGPSGSVDAFEATAATAQSQTSKILVKEGALISTSDRNGGRVVLIGPEVTNRGTILTPDGQVILAAGQQVLLLPHASDDPSLRGLDVYVGSIWAPSIGVDSPSLTAASSIATGLATNSGLIVAERGNITMAGASINQLGVAQATTSASLNGRVDLQAVYAVELLTVGSGQTAQVRIIPRGTGLVTLGTASLTQILPEYGSTEKVVGTSLALNSQVNITGLAAYLGENAHILAPSGDVTIRSGTHDNGGNFQYDDGQIYLDSGAAIDVFGSIVQGQVSDNIVGVELLGAQLADSPLQRSGFLRGRTIYVDIRQTGRRADGSVWVGTPLADASGYVGLIQRNVGELTTAGGSVTLNAGASVVMQQDASVNVSNGWIDYQGGVVHTTRLRGADGGIYDISQATPDRVYVGFAGEWSRSSERWGITETWTSPLARHGVYQAGYIHGSDGGAISIHARTVALDGLLQGHVVSGERQREVRPKASSFSLDGALRGGGISVPISQDVIFQSDFTRQPAAPFNPDAPFTLDPAKPIYLSPDLLAASGFVDLSITSGNGDIQVLSAFSGQAGGSLTLTGKNIDIAAGITLAGGTLNLNTANVDPGDLTIVGGTGDADDVAGRGTLTVRSNVILSTAGLIVDQRRYAGGDLPPLALDGGSISLDGLHLDLQRGGVIDVSGGIAIHAGGKTTNGDGGRLALRGGLDPLINPDLVTGQLTLDATLKGYAPGEGGSLALSVARRIQVGGSAAGAGTLLLSPDFFSTGGFSSYSLTSRGGIEIAAGTHIAPEVQSYALTPTDASLVLAPTFLAPELRSAVAFSLNARGYLSSTGFHSADIVIAEGASIRLDPTLAGTGKVSIDANGGRADIQGSIVVPGGAVSIKGDRGGDFSGEVAVILGENSVVSTAGTTVLAPNAFGLRQGKVLDGGVITVAGNIDARAGAVLDVSGAGGTLDVPSVLSSLAGGGYAPLRVDSNGGLIVFDGDELLSIAATLRGAAGDPSGMGGSLVVAKDGYSATIEPNLIVNQSLAAVASSAAHFAIDTFEDGGFDSLTLHGNVGFAGSVSVTARRSITLATTGLITADGAVNLDAPYVALGWPYAPQELDPVTNKPVLLASTAHRIGAFGQIERVVADPRFGTGSLNISASLIDVGDLALQDIGQVHLDASRGDIRGYGTFTAAGDITLTAGQLHPTTVAMFTIAAFDHGGTPGTITINPGAPRALPLSAGGTLNIFASEIHQNGVLRAPLGNINVGSTTAQVGAVPRNAGGALQTYATTTTLSLGAGSVTSVSAVDPRTGEALTLPYGTMLNGTAWIDPHGSDITAEGGPAKTVTFAGQTIDIGEGATIDLRGGGDLTAYNWVGGLGGSRDILASSSSFAILPGYQADYAPLVSIASSNTAGSRTFQAGWSNGALSIGDRVWLEASSGLPAGYYTLLPARYALLPGAFLVTPGGSAAASVSVRRPDGSSTVSGYRGNALTQWRAPLPILFEVASETVVRARAQYDTYSANVALREGALARDAAVPRLPVDAGQLVLAATRSLNIQGQTLMSAPSGGLGGLVDIGTPSDIVINNSGTGAAAGTLYINATGLSAFGAESLLIGGIRGSTAAGTTVNVTTASIELDNDEASLLHGPEIILASKGGVTLRDGAAIAQLGTLSSPAQTLLIDGNGALLRVSSDISAGIVRSGVTPLASGSLTVGSNARITGSSVILDSTDATTFDPSARLTATALTLGGGQINLLFDGAGAPPGTGLVLSSAVLRDLQSTIGGLSLLSYSSIDLYGTGSVGTVDAAGRPTLESLTLHTPGIRGFNTNGGSVIFNARNVVIDNSPNGAPVAGVGDPLNGALVFNTETVTIGTNAVNVTGYADLDLKASGGVLLAGRGGLSTAGNLTVAASVVTGSAGARQGLTSDGVLTVSAAAGEPAASIIGGLGAELVLAGSRVGVDGTIRLPGGLLTLHATGTAAGSDVVVGGTLDVSGTEKAFHDQIRYTSGGQVVLKSDAGSVRLEASGIVDVAARPEAGNAGSLTVTAAKGTFTAAGTLRGHAGQGGTGGAFALDVGSQQTLAVLNAMLNAGGFDAARAVRVRTGDVLADGSAKARSFLLAADDGAITVTGSIDASGETGGHIGLYGYNGVTLADGSRLTVAARKLDAAGKGGAVDIETGQAKDIAGVLTPGIGWIDLQAGSAIDLSVAGGRGGRLHLRAPQITGIDAAGNPIPTLVNSVAGGDDLAIKPLNGAILNPSSVVVEGFQVFDLTDGGVVTPAVQSDAHANAQAFTDHTAAIRSRLLAGTANAGLAGPAFYLRPGVELVSRGDLMLGNTTGATQVWDLSTLRYGPGADPAVPGSGEPGILTLRASGDLVLQGSLSDGFLPGPNNTTLTDTLLPAGSESWSYRLVAGADLSGAEFRQVLPLEQLGGSTGSLLLGRSGPGYNQIPNSISTTAALKVGFDQLIRTGTGDIDIAAGRDVQIRSQFSTIYTAGSRVIPGNTTTATLAPGGAVNMRSDLPLLFPNGTEGGTITATIDSIVSINNGGANDLQLPAGTIYSFPEGFSPPNVTISQVVGVRALQAEISTTVLGATVRLPASDGEISGFGPGAKIIIGGNSITVGGVQNNLPAGAMTASGPGIAYLMTQNIGAANQTYTAVPFSAGDPLPLLRGDINGRGDYIVLTSGGALTRIGAGTATLIIPAGVYTLKASTASLEFPFLPAGSTLRIVDPAGGSISTPDPATGFIPAKFIATVPLPAGTPIALPAGSAVTAAANGVLSLNGGAPATVALPAADASGNTYVFDMPVPGSDGRWSQSGGNPAQNQLASVPFTTPQYSNGGGNITVAAGQDIIRLRSQGAAWLDDSSQQLPVNWLYRRGSVENGAFTQGYFGDMGSTTWWVDFSNFFEGVGTLGGGNLTLAAGRDVKNVDAVAPTNAWMPYRTIRADGTIDDLAANQPLFEYGGGDLVVNAGRNIDAGVYYVERGRGSLGAGGGILTNATRSATTNAGTIGNYSSDPIDWLPTTLFLGKGGFDLSAHGDVLLGSVANPFLLPQGVLNGTWARSYFSTYDAENSVSVSSLTGDVTLKVGILESGQEAEAGTLTAWFGNVLAWQSTNSTSHRRPWLRLTELRNGRAIAVWPARVTVAGTGSGPSIENIYRGQIGLMPPNLEVAAYSGDIGVAGTLTLAPSPNGTVNLFAAGSINGLHKFSRPVSGDVYRTGRINLSDVDPNLVPGIRSPMRLVYSPSPLPLDSINKPVISPAISSQAFTALFTETGATKRVSGATQQALHDAGLLHLDDPDPVYLYAGSGDISGLTLFSPKATRIYAGNDITDVAFYLQNLRADDVSRVVAGRDILPFNERSPGRLALGMPGLLGTASPAPGDISIGGPGTLEVLAGRNLDLGGAPANGTLATQFSRDGLARGIVSIGNLRNPYLPDTDGADIIAAAGLGVPSGAGLSGNLDVAAFVSSFLDPATAGAHADRYLPALGARLGLTDASDEAIWNAFNAKSDAQKEIYALDIFYLVLRDAGRDRNDPDAPNGSRNYEAGYEAIAKLFPGEAWNGSISLTAREIKTESGGDINLLTPGGGLLVGFDLSGRQPLDQGLMTLRGGNISIFAHDSVTVGTSRIFTFRGGNEVIWSTVGDIAAGSASKTLQAASPARYVINPETGAAILDLGGLATGGGIGVLQTRADVLPSDVDLIAPSGYIDAGDAGIRVSGNLNLAALQVINADNIQVQGTASGIPVVAAPNVGAITAAANTAGSVAAAATEAANRSAPSAAAQALPTLFRVEMIGYGPEAPPPADDDTKHTSRTSSESLKPAVSGKSTTAGVPIAMVPASPLNSH